MKKLVNKKCKSINYFLLILILFFSILLSLSYTTNGKFVFLSGLFSDRDLFDLNFTITILGTISLVFCAIGLNVSGEIMQATTHNPLSSPFSLGLSSSINLIMIINVAVNGKIPLYAIGFLALIFIFIFNILPIYLINNKTKNVDNIIFFGVAISSLITTITLIICHIYSLDVYVYGWMTNYTIKASQESIISGLFFIFLGLILLIFNIKKLSIVEQMGSKANTLGVNTNKITLLSLFIASFFAIGASIIYAPLFLLGLVIPYLTKKFIIKKFSFKHSIFISSCLAIILLMISRILLGFIKFTDFNMMLSILLLPTWSIFEINNKIKRNKNGI